MDNEQVAEIAGCIDTSSTFLALVEMQVRVDGNSGNGGHECSNIARSNSQVHPHWVTPAHVLLCLQVGVQASVLLGTASSSITETVVYERLAQVRGGAQGRRACVKAVGVEGTMTMPWFAMRVYERVGTPRLTIL
jgi:hypothetical protein